MKYHRELWVFRFLTCTDWIVIVNIGVNRCIFFPLCLTDLQDTIRKVFSQYEGHQLYNAPVVLEILYHILLLLTGECQVSWTHDQGATLGSRSFHRPSRWIPSLGGVVMTTNRHMHSERLRVSHRIP
jgi:hypothetical protein